MAPVNDEQIAASTAYLKNALRALDEATAQVQHAIDVLQVMDPGGIPPARAVFVSPVTGRAGEVFGGDWFIATRYAERYDATGKRAVHTGVDLNRPGYRDSGATVYAPYDGEIVVSRAVTGWQGMMVVIRHRLPDGRIIWTRQAHLKGVRGLGPVVSGEPIGLVGDYTPVNDPRGDHDHYDVARIDLESRPEDWPGDDEARVRRDYLDPVQWHQEHGA